MDEFLDDDFDDLNDTVLQELENHAIQATQAQRPAQSQAPAPAPQPQSSGYGFGFEDDDLDDAVVIDESAQKLAGPVVGKPLPPQQSRMVPAIAGQPRLHQGGQPSAATSLPGRPQPRIPPRPVPPPLPSQRHHPRPLPPALPSQRYPPRPLPPQSRPAPPASQFNRPPPPGPISRHVQPSQATGAGNHTEVIAALQAQLSALQSELTSAKGESAILRSKYDKTQTSHEAEVARLKKLNAEQLAKQERAVEAAIAAERHATTELQFARQDLKEELGRAKNRRKDGATTPKKNNKNWGVGDGFDHVEILPSPTKGQGQRRRDPGPVAVPLAERTPTKGKRKRPAFDSPVMALETHSDDAIMLDGDDDGDDADAARAASLKSSAIGSRRTTLPFDFLMLALDHSALHGHPLTFDLFSRYAFPSDPTRSFASAIFEMLPRLGKSQQPIHLLIDFCEMILEMWVRCINERYYQPIFDLVALLSYTLQLNTISVAPHIVSTLLPTIQTTCFLVALPRFNSFNGDLSTHLDGAVQLLERDVDVTQSLSLLYLTALGCLGPIPSSDLPPGLQSSQNTPQMHFWKHMQLEFILMMLCPKHPEEDFLGMLSLLCTSVLPDSVGPIANPNLSLQLPGAGKPDDETPEFSARSLIDRISFYLAEPPNWAPRGSAKQCWVRLVVLRTLMAFAQSPFGALQLAGSALVIPRLVTVLCWAIDSLYDMDVPKGLWPLGNTGSQNAAQDSMTERGDSGHWGQDLDMTQEMRDGDAAQADQRGGLLDPADLGRTDNDDDDDVGDDMDDDTDRTRLLFQLISQLTLLLHTLITDPRTANVANMPAKLVTTHGASQRYLLTLARITFAEEDLVFETGIGADTVELAHELLELAVTPDEGEGVGEVFGP
ncbi:hypothetical protein QBC33DRAFT_453959 [Phialemonium atrogriseum]|uniref:DNA repair protein Rad26 n=1 Tax=Phialemonium atrogriseum TaxID=1093897 RepID=A0AAJ0FEU4_9PEZI|nr:uncharacterized protein QBC33DRAFT_453959 [Phialemonium atrogriseum]KAK1765941.1 hypothetical protein QBC33DRAFT_453959 [Phialemonium atrogriseum]